VAVGPSPETVLKECWFVENNKQVKKIEYTHTDSRDNLYCYSWCLGVNKADSFETEEEAKARLTQFAEEERQRILRVKLGSLKHWEESSFWRIINNKISEFRYDFIYRNIVYLDGRFVCSEEAAFFNKQKAEKKLNSILKNKVKQETKKP
jgi:uncharacterized Fe-S cluster-containing radical SAM superfamily protein